MVEGRGLASVVMIVGVLIVSVCGGGVPIPHPLTMLLRDPGVHRDLSLGPEQAVAVAGAVEEVERPLWLLRDLPPEERRAPADRLLEQLKGKLAETLSDPQRERLNQLTLQAQGLQAMVEPEVAGQLELSAGQSQRIKSALEVLERELVTLQRSGAVTRDAERIRRRKIRGERDILAILSKRQRHELRTLMGLSFDLSRVRQAACRTPELQGVDAWINSTPLTLEQMRGQVIVVHFYTFGCINCVRNLPHYNAWFDYFARDQLKIVGIHRPETKGERLVDEVRRQAAETGLKYPIAIDNQSRNWDAWANRIWPSVYLIDKQGFVRYWWYGELNWEGAQGEKRMRRKIEELLGE